MTASIDRLPQALSSRSMLGCLQLSRLIGVAALRDSSRGNESSAFAEHSRRSRFERGPAASERQHSSACVAHPPLFLARKRAFRFQASVSARWLKLQLSVSISAPPTGRLLPGSSFFVGLAAFACCSADCRLSCAVAWVCGRMTEWRLSPTIWATGPHRLSLALQTPRDLLVTPPRIRCVVFANLPMAFSSSLKPHWWARGLTDNWLFDVGG